MSKQIKNKRNFSFLDIILWLLVLVFCFSLFKNISYPLVWNDESDSVILGQRVIEYGYPKVHDGKNVVCMSSGPNIKDENGVLIGYKPKYDAYIYITWGNYYWAAIGVYLAEFTNDIYQKTASLRLPFALMGLFGLYIFVLSVKKLFPDPNKYKLFLIFFVIVEIFSISLILHLREARYFSLVVFISACFCYLFANRFIVAKMNYKKYLILMTLLLFFTYQINFIVFAIFLAIIVFNIGVDFLFKIISKEGSFKSIIPETFKSIAPVIIATVLIIPFLMFFEIFKTSSYISANYKFTFDTYMEHINSIIKYFTTLEFGDCFLLIKAVWIIIAVYTFRIKPKSKNNESLNKFLVLEKYSLFLTSFFIVYALIVARTPYLFVRHYIVLQPVMTVIMICDVFVIFRRLNMLVNKGSAKTLKYVFSFVLIFSFSVSAKDKLPYMESHYYEMTHQYKGDLDFIISYIQQNYKDSSKLIIATNYEEFSYMYYLGCKVLVGYLGINIDDDIKYQPDIIIFRKTWGTNPKVFNDFMQKAQYQKVSFPVADYPVNNIPELNFVIKHLFKTKFADSEDQQADIYVKVK